MDIVLVTFIGGFVLATLVFWPLLRRSQRRNRAAQRRNRALLVQQSVAGSESAAARGRHAAPESDTAGHERDIPDAETARAAQTADPHAATAETAAPPATRGRHEVRVPEDQESPDETAPSGARLAGKHAAPEYAEAVHLGGDLSGDLDGVCHGNSRSTADTAPEPGHGERAAASVVPTDLYERKYAWRFARSSKRLQRLRAELDDPQKAA